MTRDNAMEIIITKCKAKLKVENAAQLQKGDVKEGLN